MRISDWSSDVCSSDLVLEAHSAPRPIVSEVNDGRGIVALEHQRIEPAQHKQASRQKNGEEQPNPLCLINVSHGAIVTARFPPNQIGMALPSRSRCHAEADRLLQPTDRKSKRLNSSTNAPLVCRLLLDKKTK